MKGSIIFNGNIRLETDFIQTFQDRILASNHSDPVVRDSKKVLLVTAAWQKREFYESHVKEALYDIGLDPAFDGSYDQNIQNLSVYHDFNTFKTHEPELYAAYHTKQEVIQQVKIFYREKNSGLIGILQRQLRNLKATFRGATLYKALTYNVAEASRQLEALGPWDLLFHYACQDIQASMASIRANDAQMLQVCKEIDDHFFATSGIQQNVRYQTMKKALEDRILSSNSIFIFGGHIAVDDNSTEWTGSSRMYDFEFFDQGFGIVSKVQMFPHCKDYIHMEDPDTVTYLAARFNLNLPVGLDEHSFLLMDTYTHKDKEYERFVSVGEDEGLYLFDLTGQVKVKRYGEELVLPGTRFYSPLAE
jgi:hypothetical protein